eukprot:Rhum_TRINITY_DN8070_c0_g1::Rhum_TRINITY_DN8070_c0_g1_i1::g.26049::m.26049
MPSPSPLASHIANAHESAPVYLHTTMLAHAVTPAASASNTRLRRIASAAAVPLALPFVACRLLCSVSTVVAGYDRYWRSDTTCTTFLGVFPNGRMCGVRTDVVVSGGVLAATVLPAALVPVLLDSTVLREAFFLVYSAVVSACVLLVMLCRRHALRKPVISRRGAESATSRRLRLVGPLAGMVVELGMLTCLAGTSADGSSALKVPVFMSLTPDQLRAAVCVVCTALFLFWCGIGVCGQWATPLDIVFGCDGDTERDDPGAAVPNACPLCVVSSPPLPPAAAGAGAGGVAAPPHPHAAKFVTSWSSVASQSTRAQPNATPLSEGFSLPTLLPVFTVDSSNQGTEECSQNSSPHGAAQTPGVSSRAAQLGQLTAPSLFTYSQRQYDESGKARVLRAVLAVLLLCNVLYVPVAVVLVRGCITLPHADASDKALKFVNCVCAGYFAVSAALLHPVLENDLHVCVDPRVTEPFETTFFAVQRVAVLVLVAAHVVAIEEQQGAVALPAQVALFACLILLFRLCEDHHHGHLRGPWSNPTLNHLTATFLLCSLWSGVAASTRAGGAVASEAGFVVVCASGWVVVGVLAAYFTSSLTYTTRMLPFEAVRSPHPTYVADGRPKLQVDNLGFNAAPPVATGRSVKTPLGTRAGQPGAPALLSPRIASGVVGGGRLPNASVSHLSGLYGAMCDSENLCSSTAAQGEVRSELCLSPLRVVSSFGDKELPSVFTSTNHSFCDTRLGESLATRDRPAYSRSTAFKDSSHHADISTLDDESVLDRKGQLPVDHGDTVGNKYLLEAKLGHGQYSTVWLASDSSQDTPCPRKVALKIGKSGDAYQNACEMEAKLHRAVNAKRGSTGDKVLAGYCSRLLQMYDCFIEARPTGAHVVLVFNLCGPNLLVFIQNHGYRGVPLPVCATVVRQVLEALVVLASLDMVHGDVKPENVVLEVLSPDVLSCVNPSATQDELLANDRVLHGQWSEVPGRRLEECYRVCLCDLGSCRPSGQPQTTAPLQTREYRSPEAVTGKGALTCAADLWSVGCLLFELVTGAFLFDPKTRPELPKDAFHLALMQQVLGEMPAGLAAQQVTEPGEAPRALPVVLPPKSLRDMLQGRVSGAQQLDELLALLGVLLSYDPAARGSAAAALQYPCLDASPDRGRDRQAPAGEKGAMRDAGVQ